MNPNEQSLRDAGFIKLPNGEWEKPRKARASRLPACEPQPDQGLPLERVATRKGPSRVGPQVRYRITFDIYAQRPTDWDNAFIKQLQDCVIEAGFIPDDNWRVLEGRVSCHKASNKEAERTEITIEQISP